LKNVIGRCPYASSPWGFLELCASAHALHFSVILARDLLNELSSQTILHELGRGGHMAEEQTESIPQPNNKGFDQLALELRKAVKVLQDVRPEDNQDSPRPWGLFGLDIPFNIPLPSRSYGDDH
jgi:hypothetical protein